MDVYLTCLVAKSDDKEFSTRVFLPVLNNLALCTLQLGMWSKTDQFCTLALEDTLNFDILEKDEERAAVAKIYFRRGKSRRLQGLYKEARNDLEQALLLMGDDDTQERRTVQREIRKVDQSVTEGKRNEKRQERAMKKALGGGRPDVGCGEKVLGTEDHRQRRKYSTLTAKSSLEDDNDEESDEELSCWHHYLLVVVRLTEMALELLGDEETIERKAKRNIKEE